MKVSRIAIQGIGGSYSDAAAEMICGEVYERLSYADFSSTLASVASGEAEAAVVPVRNTTTGAIEAVERLIQNMKLRRKETVSLRVDHVLAGSPGTSFSTIRTVRSHPQALKQCAGYLISKPGLRALTFSDTASAVRHVVASADPSEAAIGSRRAADLYGAAILAESISDSRDNETVFCLVTR